MQYIVKVGAEGDLAHPEFIEFAGMDYFGPFTEAQATTFVRQVEATWSVVPEGKFVYGKPSVEMIPLRRDSGHARTPTQAARNWYSEA